MFERKIFERKRRVAATLALFAFLCGLLWLLVGVFAPVSPDNGSTELAEVTAGALGLTCCCWFFALAAAGVWLFWAIAGIGGRLDTPDHRSGRQ
jgi:predicted transporter